MFGAVMFFGDAFFCRFVHLGDKGDIESILHTEFTRADFRIELVVFFDMRLL
jgi:hypothetical protein